MDRIATIGAVAVVLVVGVAGTVGALGLAPGGPASQHSDGPNPCVGTVTEEPDNATLLSIQGARGGDKTDAMVAGFRPNGSVIGVHNADANGRWWGYDVDPLASGNLLFSSTEPGISVVEIVDPTTGEHESVWKFNGSEYGGSEYPLIGDSHDADLINGDELVMNNMPRNGNDSVVVYNLTRGEVVWEYRFADHPEAFPKDGGGEFGGDWTHNNDVDRISEGVFMVSVRNYDQVVAINRSTKEVEWRLGEDDNADILDEQHNPDYIEGEEGRSTVLVADSLNDRVVEYGWTPEGWEQTWVLRGGGLNEPRDADRLPNGNTLVVDRHGHRLIEVTPGGEVVWETYAPWQPYDAERVGTGDESSGPTMAELGETGTHEMTGSQGVDEGQTEACYEYLTSGERADRVLTDDAALRGTTPPADGAGPDAGTESDPNETDDTADPSDGGTVGGSEPLSLPGWVAVVAVLAAAGLLALRRE
jgi:hypothetical protein